MMEKHEGIERWKSEGTIDCRKKMQRETGQAKKINKKIKKEIQEELKTWEGRDRVFE